MSLPSLILLGMPLTRWRPLARALSTLAPPSHPLDVAGLDALLAREGAVAGAAVFGPAHLSALAALKPAQATAWGLCGESRAIDVLEGLVDALPEARFLIFVDAPEVALSNFLADTERGDPHEALRVWATAARRIARVVQRHAARCLVFDCQQASRAAESLVAVCRDRLGLDLRAPVQAEIAPSEAPVDALYQLVARSLMVDAGEFRPLGDELQACCTPLDVGGTAEGAVAAEGRAAWESLQSLLGLRKTAEELRQERALGQALGHERDTLLKQHQTLQLQCADLLTRGERMDLEHAAVRDESMQLRERLQDLERALHQAQAQVDQAQRELQDAGEAAEKTLQANTARHAAAEQALSDEQTRAASLEQALSDEQTRAASLEQTLSDEQTRAASLEQTLSDEQTRAASLEQALSDEQARASSLEQTLSDEQTRAASLEQALSDEQTRAASLEQALSDEQARRRDDTQLAKDTQARLEQAVQSEHSGRQHAEERARLVAERLEATFAEVEHAHVERDALRHLGARVQAASPHGLELGTPTIGDERDTSPHRELGVRFAAARLEGDAARAVDLRLVEHVGRPGLVWFAEADGPPPLCAWHEDGRENGRPFMVLVPEDAAASQRLLAMGARDWLLVQAATAAIEIYLQRAAAPRSPRWRQIARRLAGRLAELPTRWRDSGASLHQGVDGQPTSFELHLERALYGDRTLHDLRLRWTQGSGRDGTLQLLAPRYEGSPPALEDWPTDDTGALSAAWELPGASVDVDERRRRWQSLCEADRRFVLAMLDRLPSLVATVSAEGIDTARAAESIAQVGQMAHQDQQPSLVARLRARVRRSA